MTDESTVRSRLTHTWHPFYGRFGRLRPIQLKAVEPVLEGRHVLVGAPTASGKTEALAAPLLERLIRQLDSTGTKRAESSLKLIYISPTRALSRDLVRRLRRPVQDCGLSVGIKTGDSADPDLSGNPPDVLVTTPESLDSLLCRRPKTLRELRALVVDELHLLDGNARGDQLQADLLRLKQVVKRDLQICGASATLPNGEALASTYLGDDAVFVHTGSLGDGDHRSIEASLVRAELIDHAAEAIHTIFKETGDRKLLVFANNRRHVEELTAQLSKREILKDRVYAHHGSLARAERLRAEEGLRNAPAAVCVATMTLEVGIDIGDVDRTILVGPPPDVSSLLQRIGRANRQEDTTRVTCLQAGTFERQRVEHLLECAARGELFAETVPFRPSVVPQQALSLLFQNPKGWVAPRPVWKRLPREAREFLDLDDIDAILSRLAEEDYLHPMEQGRYAPDSEALHDHRYGRFHSNIHDDAEVEVVDELTQQVVGKVRFRREQEEKLHDGEELALSLGGKTRKVVNYVDDQLIVRSEEGLEKSQFIGRLPPRYSRGLARDFGRYLGAAPDTMYLEPAGDDFLFFHFLGTVWGEVAADLLRDQGTLKELGPHSAFYVTVDEPPAAALGFDTHDDLVEAFDDILQSNLFEYVDLLGSGPFAKYVPASILSRWARRAVDIEGLASTFEHASIVEGGIL
jgi:ATP-dependent Lhr-like helicase